MSMCLVSQLSLIICNPVDCNLPDSSVHGDSPGKNAGSDCHALLQGTLPTQGLNPGLLHCRWIFIFIFFHLSHQGSPEVSTVYPRAYLLFFFYFPVYLVPLTASPPTQPPEKQSSLWLCVHVLSLNFLDLHPDAGVYQLLDLRQLNHCCFSFFIYEMDYSTHFLWIKCINMSKYFRMVFTTYFAIVIIFVYQNVGNHIFRSLFLNINSPSLFSN